MSAIVESTARLITLRLPVGRGLLYLLLLAFPFFSIKPEIFRPDWWLGGALIAVFAFSALARGRLLIDPIGYTVLGFNAAVLLSTAVNFWGWRAAQWSEFFTLWLQIVFTTLLCLSLANLKLSAPRLRSLVRLWISVAVVAALYGLYQALARNLNWPLAYLPYLNPSPSTLPSGLGFAGYMRPSSVLREPTYLANYLLTPLLITVTLTSLRKDQIWLFKSKVWNRASVLILFAAFVVSFALAGYITLLGVILTGTLLSRPSRKLALRVAGIAIMVSLLIVIVSWTLDLRLLDAIAQRFERVVATVTLEEAGAVDPSGRVRLQVALLGLSTWAHHPIVGVGLNQLQFVGSSYAPKMIPVRLAERASSTHNMWLQALVSCGIVGLFFFGLVWFQALRMMWAVFRQGGEPLRWLGFAFFLVLLATMIRGLMGGSIAFTHYWFHLGMASIIYRLARSEQYAQLG